MTLEYLASALHILLWIEYHHPEAVVDSAVVRSSSYAIQLLFQVILLLDK